VRCRPRWLRGGLSGQHTIRARCRSISRWRSPWVVTVLLMWRSHSQRSRDLNAGAAQLDMVDAIACLDVTPRPPGPKPFASSPFRPPPHNAWHPCLRPGQTHRLHSSPCFSPPGPWPRSHRDRARSQAAPLRTCRQRRPRSWRLSTTPRDRSQARAVRWRLFDAGPITRHGSMQCWGPQRSSRRWATPSPCFLRRA